MRKTKVSTEIDKDEGINVKKEKPTADTSLMLRYLYQKDEFTEQQLADLLETDRERVKRVWRRNASKLPDGAIRKMCNKLGIDKNILLMTAEAWMEGKLDDPTASIPHGMRLLLDNGDYSETVYWFRRTWLQKIARSTKEIDILKIEDNTLANYGLNRGDIVLVDRSEVKCIFRNKAVYFIRAQDGLIEPRIGVTGTDSEGKTLRELAAPQDDSDRIPYAPLPDGVEMVGRVVWRSGLI